MRIVIVVTAILCFCIAPHAEAETPRIRVFGEHLSIVSPDHAVLGIGIKNKAHSARIAEELHKKMQATTLKILSGFNIKDRDIKMSGPYTAPENTSVSHIRATIRDLNKLSALIQALSTKAGAEVAELTYGHSQQAALMKKAQTMALINAKQTALSMAEVLDACLGDVIFIQAHRPPVAGDQTDKIIPDIRISKKIEVVFRLDTCPNQ